MKRRTLLATLGASPVALAAMHQPILAQESTPTASPGATPASAHDRSQAALHVRVMTFNIWIGGEQVDFANVIAAIRAAGADIVGMQEAEGNLRRLADGLGWAYANPRLQVISRYPIIDSPGANGDYVLIQLAPGQVLGVTNVHLPSDPYGTYAFRDGATADEVMTLEMETRVPMLRTKLEAIAPLQERGIPFVLTGDFNSPSHLDWTGAMGTIGGIERQEFAWPATTLAVASGFQDTYRTIHPDPVQAVGYTWPAGYPAPFTRPDEIFERIDYVWASQDIAVVASDIVGEAHGADVAITVNPFPSDHRAVVAELAVTPATPPVFVSPEH
ncbi:MAG: endonuclease/exonuclease/phosphatase family protein, partial [Thermomicrobiales bacterium]